MNKNNWNNYEIVLDNHSIITKAPLIYYIEKFFKNIVDKVNENQHVYVILRVKLEDSSVITLGKLQKVNFTAKSDYIDYIFNYIDLMNEIYKDKPIKSVLFSYGIRQGKLIPSISTNFNDQSTFQTYYNNKLPIAFKPEEYGKIAEQIGDFYIINVAKNVFIYLTQSSINGILTNSIKYIKNSKTLFEWTDKLVEPNYIIRALASQWVNLVIIILIKS